MTPRATVAAATLAVVAAACGGSGGGDTTTADTTVALAPTTTVVGPGPTESPVPSVAPVAPSPLPQVDVRDVATGEIEPLAARLPSDRPLLVWFWAPH